MYIPAADTVADDIISFTQAVEQETTAAVNYDREQWLYLPCIFLPYRYILATRGQNPLICIGINPSTAAPDDLDNTLKSVSRISSNNGFDSFVMFNVYAQRATDPNTMDQSCNTRLHQENMAAFRYILAGCAGQPTVWAAWGTVIEKRSYLSACLRDMIAIGEEYDARWVTAGPRSRKGHPHHPLYLRADSRLDDFDIRCYSNSR